MLLLIDLTRSVIQAGILVGFLWNSLCKLVGYGAFVNLCLTGHKGVLFIKCSRAETFFSLELCFPLAPTFNKCCPVPDNTEHLLNKHLNILSVYQYCKLRGMFSRNQCTVLYKSWENIMYFLPISFTLVGIKAAFSTKEFTKGDLVWSSSFLALKHFVALWQL